MRSDGRRDDQIRPVRITPHFLSHPAGSCLIECGRTRVICAVTREEGVPKWLKGSGKGWLSAEYAMLPGASEPRIQRERLKIGGRTQEIQRLIGRSLRQCVDMTVLGEQALLVDCDVIEADGGTRTAAVTGAFVALVLAARKLESVAPQILASLKSGVQVAATSVGLVGGRPMVDLAYIEDKDAEVDMNVVMTSQGRFIELQGTAEAAPFDDSQLASFLKLARGGLAQCFAAQAEVLKGVA